MGFSGLRKDGGSGGLPGSVVFSLQRLRHNLFSLFRHSVRPSLLRRPYSNPPPEQLGARKKDDYTPLCPRFLCTRAPEDLWLLSAEGIAASEELTFFSTGRFQRKLRVRRLMTKKQTTNANSMWPLISSAAPPAALIHTLRLDLF